MDIRHLALLASQPSAAVKKREQFCGMPKRGLAFLLANVMFWQPVWAQADGIVVSAPGTSLDRAGNGVPIVNIAAPNGSGLSHNQFHDYNVGAQGVILNNATDRMQQTHWAGSFSATRTCVAQRHKPSSTKSMAAARASCAATPKSQGNRHG